jgi:hypothetical protein
MSEPVWNASETSILKAHECQKKAQFTQERVEYNVFLFDELDVSFWQVVTFIKIRSHRRNFSNSDSVEQKIKFLFIVLV